MTTKRKRQAKRKDPNVSIQPLSEQQNVWELDLQRGSRWGEPQLLPVSGAWMSLGAAGVGGSHPHTASVCGSGANQPDTGCLGVCWGRAMKAIALNKTFPSSVSLGSGAVSPNVLS